MTEALDRQALEPTAMESCADVGRLDPHSFARFARACISATTEAEFRSLVHHLVKPLLPHCMLAAAVGTVDLEHLEIQHLLTVDYPLGAEALFPATLNLRERLVVQQWICTREPLVLSLPEDAALMSARERHEIEVLGLGRIAVHGVLDIGAKAGSFFSFGQVPLSLDTRDVEDRLRLLSPFLHLALMHVLPGQKPTRRHVGGDLSETEAELLKWVAAGRTNREIAKMRKRSVATIRNQLHSAFLKLGASNRVEAARISQRLGRGTSAER